MLRKFIFDGGASTRYHTAVVFDRQTIADHSFGVAWFCELITDGRASKGLIMAALTHDLAEHMVGDIPSPSKRALKLSAQFDEYEERYLNQGGLYYMKAIGAEEETVLKFADMMEGMMFCLKERSLGNRNVEVIFERYDSYVEELIARNPARSSEWMIKRIKELLSEMRTEWKELTQ